MTDSPSLLRAVDWPLAVVLGVVALVRPAFSIAGWSEDLGKPVTPIVLTLVVTAVWVLVAGMVDRGAPVPTLVAAGLTYGVLAIAVSAVLSPLLTGELQGPLANPFSIVPVLLVNALWGLLAGALALLLRRTRSR